jgi:hypothetical protein
LEEDVAKFLVIAVAKVLVQVANGIHEDIVERDFDSNPSNELRLVLLQQLVKMDLGAFNNILTVHMSRLQMKLSATQKVAAGEPALYSSARWRTAEATTAPSSPSPFSMTLMKRVICALRLASMQS